MRRERILLCPCTEPGCTDVARYSYASLRELNESFELLHRATRKCVRHTKGRSVLSPANTRSEWTSEPLAEKSYGKFIGGQGVIIGPGHYVEAKDFPVGTRVRITCEVLLPEQPDQGSAKP